MPRYMQGVVAPVPLPCLAARLRTGGSGVWVKVGARVRAMVCGGVVVLGGVLVKMKVRARVPCQAECQGEGFGAPRGSGCRP